MGLANTHDKGLASLSQTPVLVSDAMYFKNVSVCKELFAGRGEFSLTRPLGRVSLVVAMFVYIWEDLP